MNLLLLLSVFPFSPLVSLLLSMSFFSLVPLGTPHTACRLCSVSIIGMERSRLFTGPIRCCLLRGCQKRKVPFPPMTIVAGPHFSVRIRGEDCKILSGQLRRRREGGTYLSFSLRGEKGEEKEGPSSCQARRRGRRPS